MVPILLFLLCRYVEAEPLGTKTNVFSKKKKKKKKKKNQVHIARRIITLQEVTWVVDGGMLCRIAENELYN